MFITSGSLTFLPAGRIHQAVRCTPAMEAEFRSCSRLEGIHRAVNGEREMKPEMPRAPFVVVTILFFIPFFCLFLPADFPMDRDWAHPYLRYTTSIANFAFFLNFIPVIVCDALKVTDSRWIYTGAFLQSLFLTILV